MESFCNENSEVLRVKKDVEKILERLCKDKISVTPNTKNLSHRCYYSKEIETTKDQLKSRIYSLSKNIDITRCQKNESDVVLEGELEPVVADRDM